MPPANTYGYVRALYCVRPNMVTGHTNLTFFINVRIVLNELIFCPGNSCTAEQQRSSISHPSSRLRKIRIWRYLRKVWGDCRFSGKSRLISSSRTMSLVLGINSWIFFRLIYFWRSKVYLFFCRRPVKNDSTCIELNLYNYKTLWVQIALNYL